jgi:hypothetical protein
MAGGFLGATKGGFVSTPSGGGGGGGGSALSVSEEGVELTAGATSINFVGGTVTAAAVGAAVTVTDAGGSAASASAAGIVELATTAETGTGTDTTRAVTPDGLKDGYVGSANVTTLGTVTSGTLSTGAVLGGVTTTLTSDATGDVYYRNVSGVLTRLGVGSDTEVLTLASGLPSWAAAGGGGGQTLGSVAMSDGANIAWDASAGNIFTVTLGGARTLDNPSNITVGETYHFQITQDGTGSRTLAYGAWFKWAGGTAPVLTTTASKIDFLVVTAVSATLLYGSLEFNFA